MPLLEPTIQEKKEPDTVADVQTDLEAQVIVHCTLEPNTTRLARIWPSTYLFDRYSSHKSQLLHVGGYRSTHIGPG